MKVIKIGLIIMSFASVILCHSMDRPHLERIPVDKLDEYIGKRVVYKKPNGDCENITLGKRILTSTFYEGRLETRPAYGLVYREDRLYRLLNGATEKK